MRSMCGRSRTRLDAGGECLLVDSAGEVSSTVAAWVVIASNAAFHGRRIHTPSELTTAEPRGPRFASGPRVGKDRRPEGGEPTDPTGRGIRGSAWRRVRRHGDEAPGCGSYRGRRAAPRLVSRSPLSVF